MTNEEIKQRRKWIDSQRGDKWHPTPHTSKPCPTCGETGSRPVYGLCHRCREAFLGYLRIKEGENETAQGTNLYQCVVVGYYPSHYRDPGYVGSQSDPRHLLSDRMEQLINRLSVPDEDADWNDRHNAPFLPSKSQFNEYARRNPRARRLAVADAELIEQIDHNIRRMMEVLSDSAKAHGTNLLAQLAAGEITVDEFNRLSCPEYGKE